VSGLTAHGTEGRKCHNRTLGPTQFLTRSTNKSDCNFALFDHLVGAGEQRERDGEAKRLCCFEIDDQLDPRYLHHRQIGRLSPLENPPCLDAGLTV
jgi:hypothetical protein